MRKLPVTPVFTGFWSGVLRGVASSNEAFEPSTMSIYTVRKGLISDREAIRGDVKKAEKRLARSLSTTAWTARAG